MKFKRITKIGALAVAACLAFSTLPAFADETQKIKVTFKDVTESDLTTLSGEAKIMVSVSGAKGKATIAQSAFGFDGDLQYKSINFLKGENNPPAGVYYSPNAKSANADKKFSASIISRDGIDFADDEDLFVITFSGEPGKAVTLNLSDLDATYCTVDGKDRTADGNAEITVNASENENKGKKAAIKLTMDKVTDFNGAADANTGITVTITKEDASGYTMTNVLDNALVSNGGNRESAAVPTFTLENTVLDGSTYTVEVSGIGYVTYKKTGVTFDEVLEITNADFIPGDVNADGKVDAADKKAFNELNGEYSEAADFNRDGKADNHDYEVLKDIPDGEASTPAKMTTPTVTGGSKIINVKWTKPSDESVTGYTIKYGTSSTNLSNTKEIDSANAVSSDIINLSAGTTYYVQIAAKNANGIGEYSDIASGKTNNETTPGGGGGGGGGSSSGGSSGGGFSGNTGDTTSQTDTEEFTDLSNYAWAKDSIYALKEKGIISGVSDTEFAPANNIKRGDFILILTRMLSVNDAFTENFADVPESAYYYDAVGSAKAAGIAQGSGENFMPENSITRQDLITLAYRAFLAKGYITETTDLTSLDAFGDKDSISDYAQTSMASMVSAGIIQGADGNVNPNGNATRAEVAVMCARLVELMK